jgi:hypothetical protein
MWLATIGWPWFRVVKIGNSGCSAVNKWFVLNLQYFDETLNDVSNLALFCLLAPVALQMTSIGVDRYGFGLSL